MKTKQKCTVLFLLFSLFLSFATVFPVYADVFSAWHHHKVLTFSSGSVGLQVTFNVTFGIAANGLNFNSRLDFADLRFYDPISASILDAWNESTVPGNYATIWLKLGVSIDVVMYYGNDQASPIWNASAVFERVIDSGVVLALPMNEGAGNCVDYSGNGNTGTLGVGGAAPTWVANGKFGNALSFDGGDNVDLGNILKFATTDFSILAYIKTAFVGYQIIVGNKQGGVFPGYTLSQHPINKSYSILCDGVDTVDVFDAATNSINDDAWHSIALSLDYGANGTLFQDGNPLTPIDCSTIGDLSGCPWNLYVGQTVNLPPFTGVVNGVFMFNRSLINAEAADLDNYYPQCSSSNLGKLYLRQWNNGIMPSVVFGSELDSYATKGEILSAAVVASLILIPMGILVIAVAVRRR